MREAGFVKREAVAAGRRVGADRFTTEAQRSPRRLTNCVVSRVYVSVPSVSLWFDSCLHLRPSATSADEFFSFIPEW